MKATSATHDAEAIPRNNDHISSIVRRTSVRGVVDIGEQTDLFAPSKLEQMFVKQRTISKAHETTRSVSAPIPAHSTFPR